MQPSLITIRLGARARARIAWWLLLLRYFMAYMSRKWGDRFVNEPLYAGLPLHHHAPSYNSGHVYILNRKSVELVFNALQISRQVLSPDFAKDADSYPLSCEWKDPVPDKFLPGCAQMCQRFSTLHQVRLPSTFRSIRVVRLPLCVIESMLAQQRACRLPTHCGDRCLSSAH